MLILLLLNLCLTKTTYNLDELFGSELDKVVAYYYEVTDEEAKKLMQNLIKRRIQF